MNTYMHGTPTPALSFLAARGKLTQTTKMAVRAHNKTCFGAFACLYMCCLTFIALDISFSSLLLSIAAAAQFCASTLISPWSSTVKRSELSTQSTTTSCVEYHSSNAAVGTYRKVCTSMVLRNVYRLSSTIRVCARDDNTYSAEGMLSVLYEERLNCASV